MPAHEVKINLILFVLTHHALSEYFDLRNILNSFIHQIFDDVHIDLFDLILAQKSIDIVQLLMGRLNLVIFEETVTKLRKF